MSPIFINNSSVPNLIERIIPFDIQAVSLFFVVFCRGEPSERIKRHETIPFHQYLETLVVGYLLICLWDYVKGRRAGLDSWDCYLNMRSEIEAWENDKVPGYLKSRRRWAWIKREPFGKFSQDYGADF